MKFEREEQRYEYALSKDSVVLDIGAYHGKWSAEIFRRYGCKIHAFEPVFFREAMAALNPLSDNVQLYCVAVGGVDREISIGVQADCTGIFSKSEKRENVPCISVNALWKKLGLCKVDLIKINIEGMEVELLDALCESRFIDNVERLQVQYHAVIPGCKGEIERIEERLRETHAIEWGGDSLVWTSYVRNRKFRSNSQAGQDKFVYLITGQRPGTFLDIGSSHPVKINNTYALEQIGWTGILIDSDTGVPEITKLHRTSEFRLCNAVQINWETVPTSIDYLSLDVDEASLDCLKTIPFGKIGFRVITIEHDSYRFGDQRADEMRKILSSAGYSLIAKDVKLNGCTFEDWWVCKELEETASCCKCEGKDWKEIVG